ncbi:hypothetical protein PHYBOEH_006901 [Phytophthora boehmeriae]|uniref:Uncharacterized protein n=1 Tax=Phytophthora boehmeriae TaxID=109152 RepID=A0A8T1WFP8_9STRA|nr:hypothetical protein PHYBOEH_006901 [Phytophthora boehmeriae]
MSTESSEDLVVYAKEECGGVTNTKLVLAIAHVSPQTQGLANYQAQIHASQQLQAQQLQLYTEARVQQARVEAQSRTDALLEMIRASQIDPAALEEHVNSKLQSAIAVATDMAQNQARAVVEAHAA